MPTIAPRIAAARHRMITSCFIMYMIDLCEDTYFRVINQRNEEYFSTHPILLFRCHSQSYNKYHLFENNP